MRNTMHYLKINDSDKKKIGYLIHLYRTQRFKHLSQNSFLLNEYNEPICTRQTLSKIEQGVIIKNDSIYEELLKKVNLKFNTDYCIEEFLPTSIFSDLLNACDYYNLEKLISISESYIKQLNPFKEYIFFHEYYECFKWIYTYYSSFELISIYAETNRSALAYTYCEKSRSIFNRLQNYTTMFFIDFFQCNCLTNLGLYENSIQNLTELLNNIDQSSNKYISTIYHSLAWCYLLNCQYSECIKYTNLAIENKDPSCDLCYFIPYSYYKQKEYLKCLDYIESHLEYADDFYKPFLQAISARIQKQYVDFEKNIILYYQSLLQNNVYEDIPLIQNFILDYYTETNNKDMMIKILIDIKSFNDKDLTLKSSTLFVDSSS